MAGVGIGLGIFVFLLVSAFTSEFITKPDNTAGCLPGLIAAVWVAWPFFHHAGVSRYNFLHPVPREYKHPLKQVFAQVRDILADASYNFGDKWHVSTADAMQRRILASLRFTEEESHLEGSSLQNMHMRKERVQRFLELEVQFKDNGNDTTVVQFDFHPSVEGANWSACDHIVRGLVGRVEAGLGPGVDRGRPADTTPPAPPWWLIGIGVLAVLNLGSSVMKAVFQ
ncbi:MAG: hypothetical protein K2X27_06110 [Candidatus Obscuribacterales bacterium]|nr:hypothetical protein [Candidatus Obscuribacterales bacterium]